MSTSCVICLRLLTGYRRVEGEIRSKGHDDKTAVFDGTTIPLRRWEDWEKSRLRKLRREERRRKEMERHFGGGFYNDESGSASGSEGHGMGNGYGAGGLSAPRPWASNRNTEYDGSDAGSIFSSDEDVWGGDVGGVSRHRVRKS